MAAQTGASLATLIALTTAQRRALVAVHEGLVERYYDARGNRFVPQRLARSCWALERRGLIRDGKDDWVGVSQAWAKMELTPRGVEALNGGNNGRADRQ